MLPRGINFKLRIVNGDNSAGVSARGGGKTCQEDRAGGRDGRLCDLEMVLTLKMPFLPSFTFGAEQNQLQFSLLSVSTQAGEIPEYHQQNAQGRLPWWRSG